jgi:hypothetical protein
MEVFIIKIKRRRENETERIKREEIIVKTILKSI